VADAAGVAEASGAADAAGDGLWALAVVRPVVVHASAAAKTAIAKVFLRLSIVVPLGING